MDRLVEKSTHALQPSNKANIPVSSSSITTIQTFAQPISVYPVSIPSVPAAVYQQASKSTDNTTLNASIKGSDSVTVASNMSEKNESSSTIEKGHQLPWEGYEDEVLPEKTNGRTFRNLRHQVFSLYRRLFGIIFVTNMSIFIATLVRGNTNAKELGLIVVANLFCAILMRQDYVINAFFNVACSVPAS